MGLDVRGEAFAIFVEGEWSVHGDGDPDGWMCYAGTEPVYREPRPHSMAAPTLEDALELMKYGAKREDCERRYAEDMATWERDHKRWGCHHYELDVVPQYSTRIADAWLVVENLGGVLDRYLRECAEGWEFGGRLSDGSEVWGQADTAPMAICLGALKAVTRTPAPREGEETK